MQLGLVALAMVFLSSMGHSDVLKLSKARRQRRVSTEGPPSCPKGCDRCSEYNGCIKCKPKLFIFLERNDIRQIGVCLASCPMGYFGMRNPEGNNRCTQCKIDNCEACFNRNFCTKCKEGLYSHSGRCYVSCPPDQRTSNETMECVGQRPAECELGEWSQWGSCMKKNKTCGFKKGSQSRVRVPLPQIHSPDTSPAFIPSQTCTPQTERRKCVVSKTPCPRERKVKSDRQDDTNRRERENARGRVRDGSRGGGGGAGGGGGGEVGGGGGAGGGGGGGGGAGGGAGGGGDGGGGGGGKRRKGQSRTTTVPTITTSSVSETPSPAGRG